MPAYCWTPSISPTGAPRLSQVNISSSYWESSTPLSGPSTSSVSSLALFSMNRPNSSRSVG
jgi:hypothetical protein